MSVERMADYDITTSRPDPELMTPAHRTAVWQNEVFRLRKVIADAVQALHADEDRMEIADRLEREAAPW